MSADLVGLAMVVACTVIEGGAQTALKVASGGARRRVLWIGGGVSLFALEALLYTAALARIDVAVAYPVGSLSFVAVALAAGLFLGERLSLRRWAGIALIVCGAGLVMVQP